MFIKNLLFAFVTGVCLLTACKKHGSDVDEKLIERAKAENPSCSCNPSIDKYNWEGKIIYEKKFSGPTCYIASVYYDSNGEQFTFDEASQQAFNKQSVFIEKIWSCIE